MIIPLLWVDKEIEPPNKNWKHIHFVETAVKFLDSWPVLWLSLSYDFGKDLHGDALVDWMQWKDRWPQEGLHIHTLDPEGQDILQKKIRLYEPYVNDIGLYFFHRY